MSEQENVRWCSCVECIGDQPDPTEEELLRAENVDLRAKLAAKDEDVKKLQGLNEASCQLVEISQRRADAANKRLEEAEKQEPEYYILTDAYTWLSCTKTEYDIADVEFRMERYTRPIPPSDVAELQKEMLSERLAADTNAHIAQERIAELEREVAQNKKEILAYHEHRLALLDENKELERKLAEQQAALDWFNGLISESRGGADRRSFTWNAGLGGGQQLGNDMQNPQNIRVGETVFVRQQGFGGWENEVVESIEYVNGVLCAKFNGGLSSIALCGDGIRREPPNVVVQAPPKAVACNAVLGAVRPGKDES